MTNIIRFVLAFSFVFIIAMASSHAEAQAPQETLNQYIADLQKNPNDYALREKIIKHVQTMSPAPALPEGAEKFGDRAEFAVKNAKNEADFIDAANEYEKALRIAPWVALYYFNQGIAYEKGNKPKEAKRSFEFYLLATPNAQDAREVRKRIAGLEYAAEKAAREPSKPPVIEAKQDPFEALLRKIDGRRYTLEGKDSVMTIDVQGRIFVWGWIQKDNLVYRVLKLAGGRIEIKGRTTTVQNYDPPDFGNVRVLDWTFVISEDGQSITVRFRYSDGTAGDSIYLWKR